MKPRKLKELLTFAIVHKAPEHLNAGKKEMLEGALMKLTTDELEVMEDYMGAIVESAKPVNRRTKKDEEEDESDVKLEDTTA